MAPTGLRGALRRPTWQSAGDTGEHGCATDVGYRSGSGDKLAKAEGASCKENAGGTAHGQTGGE